MGKGVSSKTHTKAQLNHYANQHNPNNPAYRAEQRNHAKQTKSEKSHKTREISFSKVPVWAPDYIEYDD